MFLMTSNFILAPKDKHVYHFLLNCSLRYVLKALLVQASVVFIVFPRSKYLTQNKQQILHCWKWSFLWYNKYILTDYLNREDSPREIFAFSGVKNSSHAWIQRIFFQGRGNNCVCKRVAKEGFWRSIFGNLCEFNKFDFSGGFGSSF